MSTPAPVMDEAAGATRTQERTDVGTGTDPEHPGRRRVLTVLLVLGVLAAIATVVLRSSYRDGPLEPDAPTPQGSKAVVQVLDDSGVDVGVARYAADASEALAAGRTVLISDPNMLGADQLQRLAEAQDAGSGHLVLVQPDFFVLRELAPGIAPAGQVTEETTIAAGEDDAGEDCGESSFGAREVVVGPLEEVTDAATLYRAEDPATTCFARGDGNAVVSDDAVTVLGSTTFLTNESVAHADNAAVALNSLGTAGAVTWYVPSANDPLADTSLSLLDRIPDWVLPMLLWGVLVVIAVLVSISRRLGPVVVEPLPVTVRALELPRGRAGLMHRAHARNHAARSLRAATATRLASHLGVRHEDRLQTLASALHGHTELTDQQLHALLGPTPIGSDEELMRLAHDLDRLEKEIER